MYHVPEEESLERTGLAALQRRKLAALLGRATATNAFYRAKLGGVAFDPAVDPIDKLPFTTRAELQDDQAENPPYGTNLTSPLSEYVRLHQTSGSKGVPLRCLDTAESWEWWKRCWGVIYRAAGVTADDRFIFPFTFGPFIGFWAAFESAVALGNLSLPAGGMTTSARLRFMIDNGVTFIGCTPTYAVRMAEVAAEEGIDLASSAVRGLIVAGEPGGSVPATRARIEAAFGARVFDHWGMTELGPLGFECVDRPGGVHLTESECIVELIDPDSGAAVADGEPGELVVTNLGRVCSPLIRYRTGDRVCIRRERCACGRSFAWMEGGVLGRSDDMVVIRGNNVFPAAIEDIIRGFSEVAEFRMTVAEAGPLTQLEVEIEPAVANEGDSLASRVAAAIRDRLNFRPAVRCVASGSLPRFEMKARRWFRSSKPVPNTAQTSEEST